MKSRSGERSFPRIPPGFPPDPALRWLHELGRSRLEALDVDGAEVAFHEMIRLSNRNPAVRLGAAWVYRFYAWPTLMTSSGHLEAAWRILENGRALFESLGSKQNFETAKMLRGLSIAAGKLGDLPTAESCSHIAERFLRESNVDGVERLEFLAKLTNDRVTLLAKQGRFDEALPLARASLEHLHEAGEGVPVLLRANAHVNLGLALIERGKLVEAARNLASARDLLKGPELCDRAARVDLWVAAVEIEQGKLLPAWERIERAARVLIKLGQPSYRADVLRAEVREKRGDRPGAVRWLMKAIRFLEEDRARLDSEDFRISFHGAVQEVYRRLFRWSVHSSRAAFLVAEKARARAFLDFLVSGERRSLTGLRPSEAARLERARAERQTVDSKNAGLVAAAERRHILLLRRYEMKALSRRGVQPAAPVSVTALQRRLGENEAFVSYFCDGEAMHAFVVRRRHFVLRTLRVRQDRIAEEVDALPATMVAARREIALGQRPTILAGALADLHAMLWAPIRQDVGNAERVVIAPAGLLHHVPFAALSARGNLLLARHEFVLAPSASVYCSLPRNASSTGAEARCLLVKDPAGSLRFAEVEARALAAVYRRRMSELRGCEATAAAFERCAPRYDILHLATHAVFRSDEPRMSHFELASEQGGILRYAAADVAGLDLSRCRVAVLSACESGRCDARGADEMLGLPRAFLRAGARSVVAALWPVEDHPALAELMGDLHGGLATSSPARALAQAQRKAHSAGVPATLWAAFVAVGG